jgi:hypothetical protein
MHSMHARGCTRIQHLNQHLRQPLIRCMHSMHARGCTADSSNPVPKPLRRMATCVPAHCSRECNPPPIQSFSDKIRDAANLRLLDPALSRHAHHVLRVLAADINLRFRIYGPCHQRKSQARLVARAIITHTAVHHMQTHGLTPRCHHAPQGSSMRSATRYTPRVREGR